MSETLTREEESEARLQKSGSRGYIYMVTAIAAVGGFLFGFDTAIIAGAGGYIKQFFHLNVELEGLAASSVTVGCMVGALCAGTLSDRLGRKKVLFTAAVIFVVTAIMAALPREFWQFVAARFLMGVAVGVESMLSPMYIAEIAPAHMRGKLITLNHVALTIGMLGAYSIGLVVVKLGYGVEMNWRLMFASGAVPAFIFLVALARVPESPRWLTKQGLTDQALVILTRVAGRQHAETEMEEIRTTIAQEESSIWQLRQPGLRIALIVGVVMAIFQQITGINAILYYGANVFETAGLKPEQALFGQIFIGVVILVANLFAARIVDRIGRKPLFLWGTAGMGIFLGLTGWSFYAHMAPIWTIIFVLGYVLTFMVGLGPGFWTILAEIFPTRVRGRAMSVATFFIWLFCFIVSQTFPYLRDTLGAPKTFWLYGVMCIFTIIFTWLVVPETKGKTLEEIEKYWMKRGGKQRS